MTEIGEEEEAGRGVDFQEGKPLLRKQVIKPCILVSVISLAPWSTRGLKERITFSYAICVIVGNGIETTKVQKQQTELNPWSQMALFYVLRPPIFYILGPTVFSWGWCPKEWSFSPPHSICTAQFPLPLCPLHICVCWHFTGFGQNRYNSGGRKEKDKTLAWW